ncbi:MAG: YkgJ family cysteine cluster protein [Methanothrix sp.]|nr:YkgJ family cysteine cluster protein [Methanothrix sp.]
MPRVVVQTAFEDIKFMCQRCGSCCHHKRPAEFEDLVPMEQLKEFWEKSNLIYLTKEDIKRIGRKTGLVAKDFVDTLYEYDGKFVRAKEGGKKVILDIPVMKSKEDTTCVFYEDGCTVYPVRPRACKLFPFRVEEKSTLDGDLILSIGYNPTCPGIGKGKSVAKKDLERLVVDQFRQRSESIASEVGILAREGKIQKDAEVCRTLPGRRSIAWQSFSTEE